MSEPTTSEGRVLAGLVRRRKSEWTLFQTGYYDVLNKWHTDTGSIVAAAYEVADHYLNSGVTVHYAGSSVGSATNNGRVVVGGLQQSWDYPIRYPNKYGIVCATFVSLALWKSGLVDEATINSINIHYVFGVEEIFTRTSYASQWKKITRQSDLQEGDIVITSTHIYIYTEGKMLDQSYCVVRSSGVDNRRHLSSLSGGFLRAYRYTG